MNTKPVTLDTDKIRFVTMFTQGMLGGTIGGFFCFAEFCASREIEKQSLFFALITIYISVVIGVITATLVWVGYYLTGIRIRAATRVALVSVAATVCVSFLGLRFHMSEKELTESLITALLLGIPIALVVGSHLNPSQLFTFGSIAVGDSTSEFRAGSKSFLATLCTYPLRFLSIGTLIVIVLMVAFEVQSAQTPFDVLELTVFPGIAAGYVCFSAYVTFRSPHRVILLALGVLLNIPIALMGLFSYNVYTHEYWRENFTALIGAVFCGAFVFAWFIFLIARLNTQTTLVSSRDLLDQTSPQPDTHVAQSQFNSRSSEWERAA